MHPVGLGFDVGVGVRVGVGLGVGTLVATAPYRLMAAPSGDEAACRATPLWFGSLENALISSIFIWDVSPVLFRSKAGLPRPSWRSYS